MPNFITTDQGNITIRQAVPEDAVRLRELRIEALADTPQAFGSDVESARAETVESWIERLRGYEADNQGMISIAEASEHLVGMCGLFRGNRPKTRHAGVIWGVYVTPDWRGLHIADALINDCLAWGRDHDLLFAKLAVITNNTPAIRCYARCGFTVYGIDPKVIYYDGVYYDELLMAVQIR